MKIFVPKDREERIPQMFCNFGDKVSWFSLSTSFIHFLSAHLLQRNREHHGWVIDQSWIYYMQREPKVLSLAYGRSGLNAWHHKSADHHQEQPPEHRTGNSILVLPGMELDTVNRTKQTKHQQTLKIWIFNYQRVKTETQKSEAPNTNQTRTQAKLLKNILHFSSCKKSRVYTFPFHQSMQTQWDDEYKTLIPLPVMNIHAIIPPFSLFLHLPMTWCLCGRLKPSAK